MEHFSHPHPLQKSQQQQQQREEDEIQCSGCELRISDSFYECNQCSFFLHESCAQLQSHKHHPAHPQHPLTLLTKPTYEDGSFICDACGDVGTAFSFHCFTCQFDLHVQCSALPLTVDHEGHAHALILTFDSITKEGMTFLCDVCNEIVDPKSWAYYCKDCDFGTHLYCGTSEARSRSNRLQDVIRRQQQDLLEIQRLYASMHVTQLYCKLATSWKP